MMVLIYTPNDNLMTYLSDVLSIDCEHISPGQSETVFRTRE